MFCPECRTEYREGFTICADCGTALVPELPPDPPAEIPSEGADFEEVLGYMDEEGIDYYIAGEFSIPKGPDQRLMVRKDQAERAREILEDLDTDEEEPDAIA